MKKIPKNAKRVFKGIIHDTYQWQQKLYDGSYATYEAIKRLDTVVVIPVLDGKIIVIDEEQPNRSRGIGLVGGKIERGEKPLSAAKRELLEEAGLESKDWKLLEKRDVSDFFKIEWDIYIYIARNCKKVAEQKLEAGERISIIPLAYREFIHLPETRKSTDSWLREDLKRIKSSKKKMTEFKKLLFGSAKD